MSEDQSDSPRPNPPSWPDHFRRRSAWRGHAMRGQRPPWWPENEEWPPRRWGTMRGQPFFRRMGCIFLIFTFLAITGFLAVLRFLLAPFIESQGGPPPSNADFIFPFGLAGFVIL